MAEFYVEKQAKESGEYVVHSSVCGELPPVEELIYLGAFSNSPTAVNKADNRYGKAVECPVCLAAKAAVAATEEAKAA